MQDATHRISHVEPSSGLLPKPPVLHTHNILVVDDQNSNRKLLARLLERNGHTCTQVADGDEAVDACRSGLEDYRSCPFDTILMDYEMVRMDGPDACHELRRMGCTSFIVGVTGNYLSSDIHHFKECGADNVLPKPFRIDASEKLWENRDVAAGNEVNGCDGQRSEVREGIGKGEDPVSIKVASCALLPDTTLQQAMKLQVYTPSPSHHQHHVASSDESTEVCSIHQESLTDISLASPLRPLRKHHDRNGDENTETATPLYAAFGDSASLSVKGNSNSRMHLCASTTTLEPPPTPPLNMPPSA